jgi:hypothetical protein
MSFSEDPRERDPVHASAVRRLDQARGEQHELAGRRAAVEGTAAEPEAARQLDAGRAQVAAREAWLEWVERSVYW